MASEHQIREQLWARTKVWREKTTPAKRVSPTAGCGTQNVVYNTPSPNMPLRTTERPTPPSKRSVKSTPSPGFRDKPSGSLVKRLGLGRIDDKGAGLGKKGKTAFAVAYRSGEVTRWLKVDQNGSYPVVVFATDASDVPLARALPLCFEGLSERCHPLAILARRGTLMLLAEHPQRSEIPSLLKQLVGPLRAALADKDADVCGFALTVIEPLAELCGESLEPFLDRFLPPIARRCGGHGKIAQAALDALRCLDGCGPGAGAKIRRKVPAYR